MHVFAQKGDRNVSESLEVELQLFVSNYVCAWNQILVVFLTTEQCL